MAALVAASAPLGGGLAAVLSAGQAVAQAAIVVEGNRRVEADTIRSYFRGRTDAASIDEALKQLYATGLFSDIRITQSGGRLVVTVVENQILNRVAFEGNRRVRDAVLEVEVESKSRRPFSRARVQNDVQRILEIYRRQGRINTTVEPKIIELPENRVDLVFEINEGGKTGVESIEFVGNQAFSDKRLREVVTTAESGLLGFMRSTDVYDPDRLDADQELLRRFYLRKGYADFRVVSATADFDEAENGYRIVFTVEEGPQYRFGVVNVESNVPDVGPEVLRGRVRTKSGEVYNAELVEKTLEDLTIEAARSGYAFAQVRPRGARNPENNTIDLAYVLEEGPRVYIERIDVRGNTRTQDQVIRREFDLAEGDAYNRVLVDRAERRLNALRYFKAVRVTNEPGSAPDRVIVNVAVEEDATGNLSLGGGYSTNDGFIADVSMTERNFLGRGQVLRAAISWGEKRQGGEFSFTEPYFLGRRMSFGFDAFHRQVDLTETSSYHYRMTGGALRWGLPLTDNLGLQVRYRLSDYTISEVESGSPIMKFYEDDSYLTSAVSYTLVFDTLDNRRNPRNGWLLTLGQEGAGLGGDVTYLKTTGEARYYKELWADMVGMLKVEGGHIYDLGQDELRIFDTFFKGGETVRGFASSGFGPRVISDSTGMRTAIGGTLYAAGTAEVTFPFWFLPKDLGFRGAVFADAGILTDPSDDAFTIFAQCKVDPDGAGGPLKAACPSDSRIVDDASIRSSVGVGILWNSPFGPLRADFALPLTKEDYDKTQWFKFSGGTSF